MGGAGLSPSVSFGSDGGGVWKTTTCCSASTTWAVKTDIAAIAAAKLLPGVDPDRIVLWDDHALILRSHGDHHRIVQAVDVVGELTRGREREGPRRKFRQQPRRA